MATTRLDLQIFDREEFCNERFRYKGGEHLTALGPTGAGKTRLLRDLAKPVLSPELQGIALAMKPRDSTMVEMTRELGLRRTKAWPPPSFPIRNREARNGHTVWPEHTFDPDVDDAHLYKVFRTAILDAYKRGNKVILADELMGLSDLNLRRELVAIWTRGRSMNTGLWGGTQKPTHVPLHAYNQAEHLFLAYDPDAKARQRFDEIGGVEPRLVREAVMHLKKFQWLYIRRDGQKMCIVDK
jgi:hypothetical protein